MGDGGSEVCHGDPSQKHISWSSRSTVPEWLVGTGVVISISALSALTPKMYLKSLKVQF